MALIAYPNFLQSRQYSAQQVRYMLQDMVPREGIVNWGDLWVTQRAAGANMSVDVAPGEAWVRGDTTGRQGYYFVTNDAVVNVAVAAAHATLPRIDLVVLHVYDSTVTGASDNPALEIVQGTATSGATLANLTGAPSPPATALPLAYVLVPAAATSITGGNIGYLSRSNAGTAGAIATAPPFYAFYYPLDLGPPAIRVRRNSNQSIPNDTETTIAAFNVESLDLNAMHSPSVTPERIFITVPGYYRIGGAVAFAGSATGQRRISINLNGAATAESKFFAHYTHATDETVVSVERIGRYDYGDYFELRVYQNSGGALNAIGGATTEYSPAFSAFWVAK